MSTRIMAFMVVAALLSSCSGNSNMPRVSLMGVPVGGSNTYCVSLSSGVGALAGGILGAFLSSNQTAQNASIAAFSGAAAGGATGYLMCPPTTTATPASESLVRN